MLPSQPIKDYRLNCNIINSDGWVDMEGYCNAVSSWWHINDLIDSIKIEVEKVTPGGEWVFNWGDWGSSLTYAHPDGTVKQVIPDSFSPYWPHALHEWVYGYFSEFDLETEEFKNARWEEFLVHYPGFDECVRKLSQK